MYVHNVRNPERAWLDAEWADVLTSLKASGIHRDLVSIVTSLMGPEDRARTDALVEALEAVPWGELASREFALGERMAGGAIRNTPGLPYDYFVLMRGEPEKAEAHLEAVLNVLRQLESWSEQVRLSQDTRWDMTVWWIGPSQPGQRALRAYVFQKADVLGFAIGSEAARDVLPLVAGKDKRGAVVSLPLFRKALSKVPPPEDHLLFFNAQALFGGIDNFLMKVTKESDSAGDPEAGRIFGAIKKILDHGNLFEYSITTVETDGQRELSHTHAQLQAEKRDSVVARAAFDRRPFERFDEFIPVDATGFFVNTLLDPEPLYELVLSIVREHVPNGPGHVDQWTKFLASLGFEPQRDLFSWWSGEVVSVSLPSSGPMITDAESALFIRVKDGPLAAQKVDALIDTLSERFPLGGQPLIVSDASVRGARFRQVTHPLFMMLARPVVGVHGDWLIIGSSAKAIDRCLSVAAGETPSIVENDRFKREALLPKGPVSGISFTDMSRCGEEAGMILHLVAMLATGYAEALPDKPDFKEIKYVLRRLTPVIIKLGPVLQRIDFYSSQAHITTLDSRTAMRTERVTTFKPPRPGTDVGARRSAK
jgi:hypothetical protein